MRILTLICLLMASIYSKTIVDFKDLKFINKDFAKDLIQIDEKTAVSPAQINTAIKSLYNLGYFEDIWVKKEYLQNKDTKYTFHFIPRSNIKSINLSGYFKDANKEDILKKIPLKKSKTYTQSYIKQTKTYIDNYMKEKGYFDSQINFNISNTKQNQDINITTNIGSKIILKKIILHGNNKISTSEIENIMLLKKQHSLHFIPFFDTGEINNKIIKFNTQVLQDFYLQNGYFDFVLANHKLIVDFNTYEAKLLININEGTKYTIGDIDINFIKGNPLDNEDVEEIKNNLLSKSKDIANIKNIRQDIANIKNIIADKGYAFASIIPDIKKNDSKINLSYKIDTKNITKIRNVLIQGNTKTLDHVIRREIFLAPSDTFTQNDYMQSISALKRTGFFKDVSIEKKQINANQIDLIVKIEENKGTQLLLGGGHGSSEGLFINGSIKEKNTFGSGISNSFSGTISEKKTNFNYSIQNPRLFNSLYSLGINIYDTESNILDFNKSSIGISASLGKKISRFTTITTNIGTDDSDIKEENKKEINSYRKNSITTRISFNNTNSFLYPSNGSNINLSTTYSGFGSDVNFAKISAKASIYKSISTFSNQEIIFSYRAKTSYLHAISSIPSHERLYTGGLTSIRGYRSSSLFPEQADTKGGLMSFSNSAEISFPLFQENYRLSAFADYGMIGDQSISEIMRASYGISLQIIMGAIPIVFVFPTPLLNEENDDLRNFEMTIGNIF